MKIYLNFTQKPRVIMSDGAHMWTWKTYEMSSSRKRAVSGNRLCFHLVNLHLYNRCACTAATLCTDALQYAVALIILLHSFIKTSVTEVARTYIIHEKS